MKRILTAGFQTTFMLWILPMFLFVPYYNWTYAREHGFWKWLAFGEVVATFKAVGWPYHLAIGDRAKTQNFATETAFKRCIELRNEALSLSQKLSNSPNDKATLAEIIGIFRRSLAEAEKCDIAQLNTKEPGFGDEFERQFRAGLRQIICGAEQCNPHEQMKGFTLIELWGDRYDKWHPLPS